jgi:hypothetical protein
MRDKALESAFSQGAMLPDPPESRDFFAAMLWWGLFDAEGDELGAVRAAG